MRDMTLQLRKVEFDKHGTLTLEFTDVTIWSWLNISEKLKQLLTDDAVIGNEKLRVTFGEISKHLRKAEESVPEEPEEAPEPASRHDLAPSNGPMTPEKFKNLTMEERYGVVAELLKEKPMTKAEISRALFGEPLAKGLIYTLFNSFKGRFEKHSTIVIKKNGTPTIRWKIKGGSFPAKEREPVETTQDDLETPKPQEPASKHRGRPSLMTDEISEFIIDNIELTNREMSELIEEKLGVKIGLVIVSKYRRDHDLLRPKKGQKRADDGDELFGAAEDEESPKTHHERMKDALTKLVNGGTKQVMETDLLKSIGLQRTGVTYKQLDEVVSEMGFNVVRDGQRKKIILVKGATDVITPGDGSSGAEPVELADEQIRERILKALNPGYKMSALDLSKSVFHMELDMNHPAFGKMVNMIKKLCSENVLDSSKDSLFNAVFFLKEQGFPA